jgi:hypothetical protein
MPPRHDEPAPPDPDAALRACLNQLALTPDANPFDLLFGKPRSQPP